MQAVVGKINADLMDNDDEDRVSDNGMSVSMNRGPGGGLDKETFLAYH